MAGGSKLIKDLSKVPNIVGGLGLSIAAAQKAFNYDYIVNIRRVLAMTKMLMGSGEPDAEKYAALFKDLLVAVAPSRYQYTETTLKVALDLSQTFDSAFSVGLGLGMGGVSLNASYSAAYGYDYRAAAECTTVIHAIPADRTVLQPLLDRAADISKAKLTMPAKAEVDSEIIKENGKIFAQLVGKPAVVPAEDPKPQ